MTYNELKEGDIFLINDIRPMPKKKTSDGFLDLTTNYFTPDFYVPEDARTGFEYTVVSDEELRDIAAEFGLTL